MTPGDPFSPYVTTTESMPRIPIATVSFNESQLLLNNFTSNINGVPKSMLYGLELDEAKEVKVNVSVEVNKDLEEKKLLNVVATIPGK